MTAKFFVDTNVLLYAASKAPEEHSKQAIARALLARPDIAFSAQVLQEFYSSAVTKQRLKLTHDEALDVLNALSNYPVCPVTRELVMAAVDLRERYNINYWDAAILVAAKQLGCQAVFSEDLNDGQLYDGVQVQNPFAAGFRLPDR